MRTNNDNIKNLNDVANRKQQLKLKMSAQKSELLSIISNLQDDFSPKNLLNTASNGLINFGTISDLMSMPSILQKVGLIAGAFFTQKSSKSNNYIKILIPLLITSVPFIIKWSEKYNVKEKVIGFFEIMKSKIRYIFTNKELYPE